MQDCIFCKIAGHEINARFVHETDELAAFQDLNPQAPTHIIIIPKKHIARLSEAAEEEIPLLGRLQYAAREIAEKLGVADNFRLVANNGRKAGQSVDHLHYHLLAGRKMNWPPG
ncbi:MAG: histidine triad nucleotide-binding protein [Elusimicrobia bacterium GWA2_56_46]|nr:MAG: histidine triad nucleotide-binding protein [Elusimicrobia bacterium GWA2_56_46]OGR55061.1 MAG: histidine triad nucleotide-binding protein [Elusimicrobia bacterium GWC2_56_31]HBB67524.1 histidine triad nucleotide-binding protein [Elusimicrobiota bacterium]HBW23779.1 histidine triad nucleotide-binding protein [Elusimicrobiota bacterium]